jgi:DNA-binding NarL/FixJ family response regulator
MAPRIAVVNDYEVVVRGVASMLASYRHLVNIVELDAQAPVATPVDIALYDTFAQTQGDATETREILQNPNVSSVVVYTWNFDAARAREVVRQGAVGCLSKALPAKALVTALLDIHGGRVVVSPVPKRGAELHGDWPGRAEGLRAREAEVLALITQGLSNQEIAERTRLSINSVKTHIRNAYRKIGVTNRAKAILWGVAHDLLPDHVRVRGEAAATGPGTTT